MSVLYREHQQMIISDLLSLGLYNVIVYCKFCTLKIQLLTTLHIPSRFTLCFAKPYDDATVPPGPQYLLLQWQQAIDRVEMISTIFIISNKLRRQ